MVRDPGQAVELELQRKGPVRLAVQILSPVNEIRHQQYCYRCLVHETLIAKLPFAAIRSNRRKRLMMAGRTGTAVLP